MSKETSEILRMIFGIAGSLILFGIGCDNLGIDSTTGSGLFCIITAIIILIKVFQIAFREKK